MKAKEIYYRLCDKHIETKNREDIVEMAMDEFAIGFAEWMAKEYWLNSNSKYLKSTRTSELLEIYKKEKGL